MFIKIFKRILNIKKPRINNDNNVIDLRSIIDEVSNSILINKMAKIELDVKIQTLVRQINKTEKELQQSNHKQVSNCIARRLTSYKDRLTRLQSCFNIYEDNLDIHIELLGKLECILVSGYKNINIDQINELYLDVYEKHQEHINIKNDMKVLFND